MNNPLFKLALMDRDEKAELARIAQILPDNATIVEVGSFMGGSAAIMAVANPKAQIHCMDLFEDDPHKKYRGDPQYELFYKILGQNAERSMENVGKVLKDFKNITLHKKRSPDNVVWKFPVDLYFEDGLHKNPRLNMNLKFWSDRVKKDGYIAIHDCRPHLPLDHHFRFVDVEEAIERMVKEGYTFISHVAALVILQKNF